MNLLLVLLLLACIVLLGILFVVAFLAFMLYQSYQNKTSVVIETKKFCSSCWSKATKATAATSSGLKLLKPLFSGASSGFVSYALSWGLVLLMIRLCMPNFWITWTEHDSLFLATNILVLGGAILYAKSKHRLGRIFIGVGAIVLGVAFITDVLQPKPHIDKITARKEVATMSSESFGNPTNVLLVTQSPSLRIEIPAGKSIRFRREDRSVAMEITSVIPIAGTLTLKTNAFPAFGTAWLEGQAAAHMYRITSSNVDSAKLHYWFE